MIFWVKIFFAIGAVIPGLVGAYYWYLASRVQISPTGFEPVVLEGKLNHWTAAIIEATSKSASLNRTAALWTAIAVFFGGLLNAFSFQ